MTHSITYDLGTLLIFHDLNPGDPPSSLNQETVNY